MPTGGGEEVGDLIDASEGATAPIDAWTGTCSCNGSVVECVCDVETVACDALLGVLDDLPSPFRPILGNTLRSDGIDTYDMVL